MVLVSRSTRCPKRELLATLHELTLRVVPDERPDSGYRVEDGPFLGWKTLPTW